MSVTGLRKMDGPRGEAVWVNPDAVIGVERVGTGQPYVSRVYLNCGGMVTLAGLPSHVVDELRRGPTPEDPLGASEDGRQHG